MAPYLDCISQGVCMIMPSYSSWNGCKLHAHRDLLTNVLKDKLGFKVYNKYICITTLLETINVQGHYLFAM